MIYTWNLLYNKAVGARQGVEGGAKMGQEWSPAADRWGRVTCLLGLPLSIFQNCQEFKIHIKTSKFSSTRYPCTTHSAHYLARNGHVNTTLAREHH